MDWRARLGRGFLLWAVSAGLVGCMAAPPPAAPPEPPASLDLLHSKVDAYNAGLEAGKRIQARRDEAAFAPVKAACAGAAGPGVTPGITPPGATEPGETAPNSPGPAATAPILPTPSAPPAPATTPANVIPAPPPLPNQGPIYTPGGPAVPLSTAQ